MLKRDNISNGELVKQAGDTGTTYHYIKDVGNARDKGDRGDNTTPLDELSYTIVNILTGAEDDGICEHSGMTSTILSPATAKDVYIYLLEIEADIAIAQARIKKEYAQIQRSMNEFERRKEAK